MGGRHRARGARGTLCAWHVSFSAPPPRRAGWRSPLSAQEQRKGVSGAGGLSVAPSALCRRLCWGGGRKAVALPAPVSLLQTALALQQLLGPVRWRWEVLLLDFAGEPSLNLQLLVTSV